MVLEFLLIQAKEWWNSAENSGEQGSVWSPILMKVVAENKIWKVIWLICRIVSWSQIEKTTALC